MEFISADVGGAKGIGAAGSGGSGSATSGDTSSSSAAAVVSKRRKVDARSGNGGECGDASADSACVVQFGRFEVAAKEVDLGADVATEEDGERCLSGDLEDPGTASCCSSNGTGESADLEVKSGEVDARTIQTSYRKERIPEAETVNEDEENNATKPPAVAANPRRRRTPWRADIEDFFSAVEKKSAVQFKEKYNFDFDKEEPLRGRYEWTPLTAATASSKEKGIIKA